MSAARRGWWDSPRWVWLACGFSLCVGLAFTFVRAPHPWGWNGFDHYNDLARVLAHGGAYPTFDRMWGYPYFLALFYRVFGEHPWIPITVQVVLNALIPWLIYGEVRRRIDARTATVAALLIGVFSFNTVYASTQASEALCAVLYVASVVAFCRAQDRPSAARFALAGVLAGLTLSVRPNLLLAPALLLLVDLATARRRRLPRHVLAFGLAVLVIWTPWVARNYRLSGRFIPATTHGGIVLWIASLQVGPYAENWTANPRAFLEASPFDYSLPNHRPMQVGVGMFATTPPPQRAAIVYWTQQTSVRTRLEVAPPIGDPFQFSLPEQPAGAVLHYYFEAEWSGPDGIRRQRTPVAGERDPFLHFVSSDHFGDLDVGDELLDVFDVVRLLQHQAWNTPVRNARALDLDRDGRLTLADLDLAVGALTEPARPINRPVPGRVAAVRADNDRVVLRLKDGSSLSVRRSFSGQMTDLDVEGVMAADMVRSQRSFASLNLTSEDVPELATAEAKLSLSAGVNRAFYLTEPRLQDRYNALARVNIRREPWRFLAASVRRVARLFVSVGSGDSDRTAQFSHSDVIYAVSTAASLLQLVLFAAGVVIALRRRQDVTMFLAAVAYVPATLFLFMTTARYLVVAQPFIFIFCAVALLDAREALWTTHTDD
jgi:hypothetical protein